MVNSPDLVLHTRLPLRVKRTHRPARKVNQQKSERTTKRTRAEKELMHHQIKRWEAAAKAKHVICNFVRKSYKKSSPQVFNLCFLLTCNKIVWCVTVAGWRLVQCLLVRGWPALRSHHFFHRWEERHMCCHLYRLRKRRGAETWRAAVRDIWWWWIKYQGKVVHVCYFLLTQHNLMFYCW